MLAAGNRVIIKPSELTPACGKLLADMIAKTYPSDLVSVVNGDLGLSKKFSQMRWDHLLYTGSWIASYSAAEYSELAKAVQLWPRWLREKLLRIWCL